MEEYRQQYLPKGGHRMMQMADPETVGERMAKDTLRKAKHVLSDNPPAT
jgi:hypothetical protein